MSESSFPFQPSPEVVEDAPAEGRRKQVLLGGALAVVVMAAGGWFVLGGGDDAEVVAAPVRKKPAVAAPAPPVAEAVVVPVANTEPVGRNPFKALYVEPASGGGGAGTTTQGAPAAGTGTGVTSGGTSSGGTSGTPTGGKSAGGTTAPKPGGTTAPAPAPAPQPKEAPKFIEVREVNAKLNQVTFRVFDSSKNDAEGNSPYEDVVVKPGETFATYFKLFGYGSVLDANNQYRNCTDLLYGDARLKLCEGESYQVS